MQKNSSLVLRILSSSVCISEKAGSIIRDIMKNGNLNIVDKGINDLQTEADRSSEKCIVKSLSKQFPKLTIIGEENLGTNYSIPSDWIITKQDETVLKKICPNDFLNIKEEDENLIVWVDPLDGTSEFTQGLLDHVTILIGLSYMGKAIGGVIHQPFFNFKDNGNSASSSSSSNTTPSSKPGRTIWGLIGLGTFGLEKIPPPEDKFILTTTRSHSNDLINKSIEALNPDLVLRVGGAGNKVLQVLEGNAHCYIFTSRGCKKWDTCAPEAILHSLGGKMTDILGENLSYFKQENFTNELGVLASFSEQEHDLYCSLIPMDIKTALVEKSKKFFKCG